MPRINQKEDQYAREDFLRDVRQRQGSCDLMNGRALSDASGIPYQTLMRRLKQPEDLTADELKKLNKAIGLDPFILLALLGFSRKELNKHLTNTAQAVPVGE